MKIAIFSTTYKEEIDAPLRQTVNFLLSHGVDVLIERDFYAQIATKMKNFPMCKTINTDTLNADLVIMSSAVSNGITEVLSGMGVPVYVSVTATTWDEVELKVQGMAKAVGESERGDQVVSRMRMKRKAIEEKLSVLSPNQEKTVVALSFRGIIGKRGTLFNEILKMAHVKNGADGIDIPKGAGVYLSNELIPSINPDVFLLPVWKTREGDDENEFKKELMQNPAYQDVKAVKNNQFIFFSERYKYVMSQHVTDSVEAVARAVYPELWE